MDRVLLVVTKVDVHGRLLMTWVALAVVVTDWVAVPVLTPVAETTPPPKDNT